MVSLFDSMAGTLRWSDRPPPQGADLGLIYEWMVKSALRLAGVPICT
jgi:hypothetical protein